MSAARKFVPSNPGGGPGRLRGKGAIDYLGRHTNDAVAVAEFFVRVLNGHEKGTTLRDKIKAAEWIADRYMGKAVDVSLTGDIDSPTNPLSQLKNDELKALIKAVVSGRKPDTAADALAPPGERDEAPDNDPPEAPEP